MHRQEHPNPILERSDWINLNGEWDFDFDFGNSGRAQHFEKKSLEKKINVPFCPESKLSGIEYTDFINAVWYKRSFSLPENWRDGRVFIHFGAVDYHAVVYVNEKEVGEHFGGYTSFSFDITSWLCDGINTVAVYAEDDTRNYGWCSGKQSDHFAPSGALYTRTTGIWQTVWLEHTPKDYIESFKFYTDPTSGTLTVKAWLCGKGELKIKTSFEGRDTGSASAISEGGCVFLQIPLKEKQLWEVGHGRLYDVDFVFGDDRVKSYFGLRNVKIDGKRVLINGRSVFQRLVLDQGYYREGIYTAPSDAALVKDIELSLALGFNGARLHEKVFEPRFLYHCDRLGYIVWGEYANWGFDHSKPENTAAFISEWQEAVERDFNHPSIIGWCPFNETWDFHGIRQWDPMISTVYQLTKSWDPTRPCIDTSGNFHVITDVYDVHNYIQDTEKFAAAYKNLASGEVVEYIASIEDYSRQKYSDVRFSGKPFFVSEYGGIRWSFNGSSGWGYGTAPKTEEEFIGRYKSLTDTLLDNECIFGFCYTQLYDVESELNGLCTYDREPKFDTEIVKAINSRKAAIED